MSNCADKTLTNMHLMTKEQWSVENGKDYLMVNRLTVGTD